MFLYIGVSSLVFLNLLRLLAVWLAERNPGASRAIAGLLPFSSTPA